MKTLPTLVVSLSLLASPAAAHPGHGQNAETAFASIFHHYEAVWEILGQDRLDGIPDHAEAIRRAAQQILDDWSTTGAGLRDDADVADARGFFHKIATGAGDLADATDVAWAREAFYDLSKPMVRLNGLLAGPKMNVVYCSMARKSWLQRHETIANPYHGQAMSGCGEIVG